MPINNSMKPSQAPKPFTLTLDDFSGGLNADNAQFPLALAENELAEVLNYDYVRKGNKLKLRQRKSASVLATGPAAIKDIFYYVSPSSGYYCFVSDSDLNRANGTSYAKIGDLASTRGRMCQFNDKLIIADGGVMKYWNGTTFDHLEGVEPSSIIDSVTKDYAAIYDSNTILYNGNYIRAAQKFTTPAWGAETKTLSTITFRLKKVGSPTGDVSAAIYASNGTSVVETSSTTVASASLTTSFVDYEFTFAGTLSQSTEYYFAVRYATGGDSSNYVVAAGTSGSDISGWNYIYDSGSSTWVSDSPYDLIIKIEVIGTAPSATFVIQKQDRLYCNDVSYPNRLYYCNANDPNDWSSEDGGGYIIFDGHYEITGLAVFYDEIYIFCNGPKAIYRMTGDSPAEYVVKKVFFGCSAYTADLIQVVGSDLIFVDYPGIVYSLKTIMQYGDLDRANLSRDKVERSYLNSNMGSVFSGADHKRNYFLLATGKDNGYFLFYDQTERVWGEYQLTMPASNHEISCFATDPGPVYDYICGTNGSKIYLGGSGYTYDQEGDFNLIAKTGHLDIGTSLVKTARFVDSILTSQYPETYDLIVYTNLDETTPLKTLTQLSFTKGGAYRSPYCGNINELNMRFNQVQFKVTNVSATTGHHWLERIILDGNILSSYT